MSIVFTVHVEADGLVCLITTLTSLSKQQSAEQPQLDEIKP